MHAFLHQLPLTLFDFYGYMLEYPTGALSYALPAHLSSGLVSIQSPAASTMVHNSPCVSIERAIDTPSLVEIWVSQLPNSAPQW